MAKARVLLVDDEQDFREVLSERIKARGLDVDSVASGMEALEMADKQDYDAVILDLAMPEMDGIETLKRLLSKHAELQIIVLTGHATVKDGVEAVKLGAADFLEKPADLATLMAKIEEAQSKKVSLFESQLDDKISGILKKKGW